MEYFKVSIAGSQDLQEQFELTKDQAAFGLNAYSITGTLISDKCPKGEHIFLCRHSILTFPPFEGGPCDPVNPWRMADGSCNNLDNPLWGGETSVSSSLSSSSMPLFVSLQHGLPENPAPRVQ